MTDDGAASEGTKNLSEEEEISEEEEEEDFEIRKPTLSDILLTAEEKRARQKYRLTASKCCVDEAWRMYRRVTNSENAIEPANLNSESGISTENLITRMGVLYDPTAGMRMRFLKNKFAHLLSGFRSIKEAAYRPFMRCQKPQKMDVDGQGKALPAVAKAFYPEVYVTYTHPSTFAYKEKWTKIFNSNFVTKEDMLKDMEDEETQTSQYDVYSTRKFRKDENPRDVSIEKFDIEDIPLDSDGNPIGRSVGICEWCGKSILPIPSAHTLSVEWNTEALYCCDRYRLFIEEAQSAAQAIEAEYEKVIARIDIVPSKRNKIHVHGKRERKSVVQGKDRSRFKSVQAGKAGRASLGADSSTFNFAKFSDTFIAKLKGDPEQAPFLDKGVDTFDLPWNPAETRLAQATRIFGEQNASAHFVSGGGFVKAKTTLKDMAILIGLEEVYSIHPEMTGIHEEHEPETPTESIPLYD